jgi:predicted acylesterase/phospholipase RssA
MRSARLLMIALLLVSGGCRRDEVVVSRFWDTRADETQPRGFPERDAAAAVPRTTADSSPIGVCFAGGGIRSASATLGQLRALHETGLISRVGYISCVSGGSWAAAPYTFYAGSDQTLLGRYVKPQDLRREDFEISGGALAAALSNTEMPWWIEGVARAGLAVIRLRDNEWFGKQLEKRLLAPLGLDGRFRFVTQNETSLQSILEANPQLDRKDFLLPNPNRPFLIVNGTLRRYDLWPWQWSDSRNKRMPLEMTPLYVGLPSRFRNVGDDGRSVGGTYVQPLAYGADQVRRGASPSAVQARLRSDLAGVESQRFNLVDMMTISGSAPAEFGFPAFVAFPELPTWSHANDPKKGIKSYYHADGGLSENLGIMPLLARRVKYIIAFVNAGDAGVPAYVRELFGEHTEDTGGWHSRGVFPKAQLEPLTKALEACSQGNGALPFFVDTYRVSQPPDTSDDPFGLHLRSNEPAYQVKVAWFFLEDSAWIKQLDPEVATWLRAHKDFKNFPRYKTFGNRSWNIIDPTTRQVEALAHLTSWLVLETAGEIEREFATGATSAPTTAASR